jgi:DNA-binding IclR family transcriptional regulator
MHEPDSDARLKPTPSIQSLDRGLLILEAVAKSAHPVSVAELTELLGIDRSSAFRLANTLKRRGFLTCPSGRKEYILGPAIWRLSHRYDWSNMLVMVAHPHLKLLASQTGETAHLAVREGAQALFVDHVTGNHVISVSGQVGELVPLYCTAHGKALLADLTAQQLRALFGTAPLKAYTKHTVVSVEQLVRGGVQIKTQGLVTDEEEYQEGLRCIAAPIRDHDGVIIGSIGISAPATRFPRERYAPCAEQVVSAAEGIHRILSNQTQEASAKSA